jgi:hypothetical protein
VLLEVVDGDISLHFSAQAHGFQIGSRDWCRSTLFRLLMKIGVYLYILQRELVDFENRDMRPVSFYAV